MSASGRGLIPLTYDFSSHASELLSCLWNLNKRFFLNHLSNIFFSNAQSTYGRSKAFYGHLFWWSFWFGKLKVAPLRDGWRELKFNLNLQRHPYTTGSAWPVPSFWSLWSITGSLSEANLNSLVSSLITGCVTVSQTSLKLHYSRSVI